MKASSKFTIQSILFCYLVFIAGFFIRGVLISEVENSASIKIRSNSINREDFNLLFEQSREFLIPLPPKTFSYDLKDGGVEFNLKEIRGIEIEWGEVETM